MCCTCLCTNNKFTGSLWIEESNTQVCEENRSIFYSTSSHSRFYEGEMLDFNAKPNITPREKHLPQCKPLGTNNRVTLSVRSSASIRTKFHNLSIDLPPPPGQHNHLADGHSYFIHKQLLFIIYM